MPKIIDERGMVFGKINIIDLIVVFFILLLTPMFYVGWKMMNKPQPQSQPQINWEQKYNDEIAQWEQKYNEEIAHQKEVYKKHPRLRKYFK